MSIRKIYNVIGIMSGTSMDGLDCSFIKTNGKNHVEIICEKTYRYSNIYRKELKKRAEEYNLKKINYKFLKDDIFFTNKIIEIINRFIKENKIRKSFIDFIGLSGQTVFHDPSNNISIQLGSARIIQKKLNIKVVGNFRENDIKNGGQGAPIGAYYHKYLINKISKKSVILNIGGVANITFIKNKKLIAFDVGPGNAIIDDLMYHFFKKNFDYNGNTAFKGKINKKLINDFKNNFYFKLNYPKSLDRESFNQFYMKLKKLNKFNSITTATMMTIEAILIGLKLSNIKIDKLILTGGGRKNDFIIKTLMKLTKNKKIKLINIDKFNYDGDMLESQAFAYIAIRSFLKLPLSTPTTTGVVKSLTGGKLFK